MPARADGFGHVRADLVTARTDGRAQGGLHLPGGTTHGLEGSVHDAGGRAPPTGVGETEGSRGGVAQEKREAVGGTDTQEGPGRRAPGPGVRRRVRGRVIVAGHAGFVHLAEQAQFPRTGWSAPIPGNPTGEVSGLSQRKAVDEARDPRQVCTEEPLGFSSIAPAGYGGSMVHLVAVFLILLWVVAPAGAFGPPPQLASLVGERLDFRVRWGVIPAADASLEVEAAGDGRITLRATARTLPYIDTVYPVRSRIESTAYPPDVRVSRYFKQAKEGWRRSRDAEIRFDTDLGTARYFRDGEKRKEILVPPGVQDPLSVFYAYRTLPLQDDEVVRFDITDGKKLVVGEVRVLGRETVETPAGTFPAIRVEPIIEGIGGIFKKSPGARIFVWLTDDERRMPVKLQSKVIVGSFTAELVRIHPPPKDPGSTP